MVLVKLIAKSVGGDRMHGALSHARADGRNLGTTVLAHLKKVLRTVEHLDILLTQEGQIKRRQPVYSEIRRCENDDLTV